MTRGVQSPAPPVAEIENGLVFPSYATREAGVGGRNEHRVARSSGRHQGRHIVSRLSCCSELGPRVTRGQGVVRARRRRAARFR
jgi:hypothetical protein